VRVVHLAIHLLVLLALPPLLQGVIARVKARFAGRAGPPLLQPYHDLARLLRKGTVISRTTTWIFVAGPVVSLVTALGAGLLVPFGGGPAPIAFVGDFILAVSLLALGRFFTILAALDTGSSFEGMGGAREATFSCLAEPALLFGMLVLARASGSQSLSGMLGPAVFGTWITAGPALAAVLLSWFVVLLAENNRIPFDDPATHLELTMIHEVMALDHSGPPLAVIHYAASLKLLVFAALLVAVAAPVGGMDVGLAWAVFLAGLLVTAIAVGVVESVMARLRLPQVPSLLVAACLMSAFGAVLLVR